MRCNGDRGAVRQVARRLAALALIASAFACRVDAQMPGMPEQKEMMAWGNTLFIFFEQLEYSPVGPDRQASMDARMWYGGAYRRVWLRAEGERSTAGEDRAADGEVQLLYGRLIDPFWDAVVGLRGDRQWADGDSRSRVLLAVGLLGLAPYRFEFEPTLFIGPKGDLSARLGAAFPLLITQRLIVEPRIEFDAAMQAAPRYGVRRGIGEYELGVRLRYEFRREFAPYVGWVRARDRDPLSGVAGGRSSAEHQLVFGIRAWR